MTRILNQAVKRNAARFPDDFMFKLSREEIGRLSQVVTSSLDRHRSRSQFVILKRGENIKYRPYAFTEQGVAMLSSVLKSERAVKVNISSMRGFVKLRETLETNHRLAVKKTPRREIGFHVRETAPRYRTRRRQ